nr:tagaturonate epimerase family protein [Acidisarcina polymorpha]
MPLLSLPRYSIGVGDRFAHQAKAQLAACVKAADAKCYVAPVWNKSNREHNIVHSEPEQTRRAADSAVLALGWDKAYFCDADHINASTVDRFLSPCDFFTLDVADEIGKPASVESAESFTSRHRHLIGQVEIPDVGILEIPESFFRRTVHKYLGSIDHASEIYTKIETAKGAGTFVTEVSMDETDTPQSPPELLIILAAIADRKIPIQTIAPKFTGRFNKGVDYAGDLAQFSREFFNDVAVLAHAVNHFGLPANLKLSVHSGSDKFSIYKPIREALIHFGAGVHLKTAGTTWLEELIGLAEAGGDGLIMAKEIYREAYARKAELCAPYAAVIDIDPSQLPSPSEVSSWTSDQFTGALRHEQTSPAYNPSFRQLLHVGFKVAAAKGTAYLQLLERNEPVIAGNVTTNLFDRHISPLFL